MAYEKKFGYSGKNDLTPKQWAWEFLRRNPDYRQAYAKINTLSKSEFKAFNDVQEKGFDAISGASKLPLDWFEIDHITADLQAGSVAEWLKMLANYLRYQPDEKNEHIDVRIEKKLLPSTYALGSWIDPEISPLQKEDLYKFGVLTILSTDDFRKITLKKNEIYREASNHDLPWMWRRSERSRPSSVSYTTQGISGASGVMFDFFSPARSPLDNRSRTGIDLRIDINFPLRPQLEQLTNRVDEMQKFLESERLCYAFPKRADKAGIYKEYLQILDFLADGKKPVDIAHKLKGKKIQKGTRYINKKAVVYDKVLDINGAEITASSPITADIRKKIERALDLRDFGYLALAFMS